MAIASLGNRWALRGGGDLPALATAAFHTFAENVTIDADGRGALLRQAGRAVRARVGGGSPCPPAAAAWALTAVRLAPPQEPSDGLTRVDVTVDPRACGGLDIELSPVA